VLWCCWLGGRKLIRPVKNMGRWWRWALVSPDGVTPSRMVSLPASVNLPLHHKVQKFSSGTGSPWWSRKKGRKTVVVWWCGIRFLPVPLPQTVCWYPKNTDLHWLKNSLGKFELHSVRFCTCQPLKIRNRTDADLVYSLTPLNMDTAVHVQYTIMSVDLMVIFYSGLWVWLIVLVVLMLFYIFRSILWLFVCPMAWRLVMCRRHWWPLWGLTHWTLMPVTWMAAKHSHVLLPSMSTAEHQRSYPY